MMDGVVRFVKLLSPWHQLLLAIGLFAATFVLSLAAVAVVLFRLPATYFQEGHVSPLAERHPFIRWIGLLSKNALGAFLILLGLVMSLPGVPGQGLLTILIGVMLLDFPGKRRLERRLVAHPRISFAINRWRARFGKPPLLLD